MGEGIKRFEKKRSSTTFNWRTAKTGKMTRSQLKMEHKASMEKNGGEKKKEHGEGGGER